MIDTSIFHHVADDPHGYAADWKRRTGKQVIGYLCTYTPEEIIFAADALPFRIFGASEHIAEANAFLQAYCCSLARGGLEEALTGRLSFLDGAVFPHTCDTIQRLSDIWRLNAGFSLHFDVVLPVKLNSRSATDYVVSVFDKFRSDVANRLGREITDQALSQAIAVYNRIRELLAEIYAMRSNNPALISGRDVYAILKSAMVMDRRELAERLAGLVADLKRNDTVSAAPRCKRLVLAGGVCNFPNIHQIIEEAGGDVVWDELCTGSRYFDGKIRENGEPISAIAERYSNRIICPAKHTDLTSRGENLVKLVQEHRAAGVIFLFLKFCDPHAFDYPYLKEYLDNAGIPSLHLELEQQLPSDGQVRTRLEAFMEMV
ncbi:MAG: 2-hydroxyacyl-CoA dehydratase subunit D [Candidatus Zhuqueibacterota bacterium]